MEFEIQRFAGLDSGTLGNAWFYFVATSESPPYRGEGEDICYATIALEGSTALDSPFWGFCPEGTDYVNYSGAIHILFEDVTLKIYGLASLNNKANAESTYNGVEGNATAITATAAGELSDILIEGEGKTSLTITIDGTAYPVLANGRIVSTLPDFGLMTKADKQKLDRIPDDFSNFITGGVMTANGFVLTNNAGEGVVTIPAQV